MKLTNKQIKDKVEQLAANGEDIAINFVGSPARGRITNKCGDRDLSERMNATDLHIWLDGFMTGIEGQSESRRVEPGDHDTGHHVE